MATYSEVKTGLDAIAAVIAEQRSAMGKVKSNSALASTALADLAADYADVVATIQAYGTADAAEAAAKAELGKLVAEFTALKSVADQVAAINP
jgi:hypothetical protein